jgi:outer membrane biosynthesis protein TonB
MATYAEFLKKQKEYNDRDDAAMEKLIAASTNLAGDVKFLKDTITKLQNTAGQVTPEDQALIDQLESRANTTATKFEALNKSLTDLDNQTAPEVPPAPPAEPNPTPTPTPTPPTT